MMSPDEQRIHDWLVGSARQAKRDIRNAKLTIARDIAAGRQHFPSDPDAMARMAATDLWRGRRGAN